MKLRIWKFEKIEPLSFLELHADSKYMHVCPVLCAVIANFENTLIQFSPLIMFRRQYFFAFFRRKEAQKKLYKMSHQPSHYDKIPLSYDKIEKQSMP